MELLKIFKSKTPKYSDEYKELVELLSRKKKYDISDGTDEERFERGKIFSTYYECYMYASIIGMRANNKKPFKDSGSKFLEISSWKPEDMTQYIFMSLLALADFEFDELENLNKEDANSKANELVKLLESYANGGFEIIKLKLNEEPNYFENSINSISFLTDFSRL